MGPMGRVLYAPRVILWVMGKKSTYRDQASPDEALAQVHGGNSIRSVSRETKIPRTLQRALDGGMLAEEVKHILSDQTNF